MFKFHNHLLPISFQKYFQKVETIPNKSTRNSLTDDSYFFLDTTLEDFNKGVKIWKSIPLKIRKTTFNLFKKSNTKTYYSKNTSNVVANVYNLIYCTESP